MASPEGQKAIPQTNWMYPVIDLGTELPAAFGSPPAKQLPVDETTVTANRSAWIEEALAAIR
jgi:thiamine transport system substrate-binding protein